MLNSSKPVLHQAPCTAAFCAPAAQQDEVIQPQGQPQSQQWSTHKPITLAHSTAAPTRCKDQICRLNLMILKVFSNLDDPMIL